MFKTLLILLIFACCSFHIPQDTAPSPDKIVIKTAESQLSLYLAKIPPGHDSDYGFSDKDKLEDCEIGKPYRVMVFNHDFYTADIDPNINYLEIKNEWRAPVRLTGQDRVLLTVAGSPANLSVTEMGGTELAKELRAKTMVADTADEYYVLRIFPLSADFFVAEHEGSFSDAKFVPLSSAIEAIPSLKKNKKTSYTLEEVQQMVKDEIKNQQGKKAPVKKVKPVKNKSKKIKLQSQ